MKKILSVLLAICLLAGMLSVVASAATPNEAFIRVGAPGKLKSLEIIVEEGGDAAYLLTNEDGKAIQEGADASNYNIKFEYKDGMATIYLKNAKLKNEYWAGMQIGRGDEIGKSDIYDFPVTVYTEADSEIEATYHENVVDDFGQISNGSYTGITTCANSTVFTGPGKLTIKSQRVFGIWGSNVTFKDANIYVHTSYDDISKISGYPSIWINDSDLVIDNTELTVLNNCGTTLWLSEKNRELTGNPYNIVIKNGSKVELTNEVSAQPAVGTMGKFIIDKSDVVIHAQSVPFNTKPEMTGVTALGGTKPSNAKEYNAKKATTYLYFVCGPDVQVPTIETLPPVTVPPTTQQVPPTTQQVPPTTNAAPNATEPVDTNTGSSNGAKVLIIVLVSFAVVGIGAAVAVIIINKKKGKI